MRKVVFFCSILLLIPLVASKAGAQETSGEEPATAAPARPVHYYHFDIVVEDLDVAGKVANSRSYSTTVDTQPHILTSIRTGSRIPIATGMAGGNTQFTYIDLGVELDIRDAHEVGPQLAFDLTANLSGEASVVSLKGSTEAQQEPVIRQNKWSSRVLVPIGKRTVVFTSDSLDSKGSTRVLVTATPLGD
ncbi:MAG TPA: hypothetical protein VFW94_10380 [Candidatus Acidoferrales bacterium]|nr:hypothetical protein [Candidatus Acidoferrales bacterium]